MKTLIALLIFPFLTACTPVPADRSSDMLPAALEGHVTFGPLTPVIRIDEPTPEIPPEAYDGRFVLVSNTKGDLLHEIPIGPDGYYRFELAPDIYIINVTTVGIESAKTLPAEIKLVSGETFTLDIDIDTGIR